MQMYAILIFEDCVNRAVKVYKSCIEWFVYLEYRIYSYFWIRI